MGTKIRRAPDKSDLENGLINIDRLEKLIEVRKDIFSLLNDKTRSSHDQLTQIALIMSETTLKRY